MIIYFIISASNFKINGGNDVVVNRGDTITVEVNIDKKEAKFSIYHDANGNKSLDNSDNLIYRSKIIDGSWKDVDEVENGYYKTIDQSGSSVLPPAQYVCVVDDGNPAYVALKVVTPTSSYGISGKIEGIPNKSNIVVIAVPIELNDDEDPFSFSALSDNDGNYVIYIPDSLAMRGYSVTGFDIFVKNPGFSSILDTTSINVDGMETKDINFVEVSLNITGYVVDQDGNLLNVDSGFVHVYELVGDTILVNSGYATDNYHLYLKEASLLYGYSLEADFPYIHPDYMEPVSIDTFGFGLSDDIDSVNITVYEGNAKITGHIYKNDNPADNIEINCKDENYVLGYAYSGTYSDGYYELFVYDTTAFYKVYPEVPQNCESDVEYKLVPPGATNVDFHLTCTEGVKNITLPIPDIRIVRKSQLIAEENIEIYSINGRMIGNRDVIEKLSTGFYYLKSKNRMYKVLLLD